MDSVLTDVQKTEITDVLILIFKSIIDLIYTIILTLVDFFTRPDVLWALAVLMLIVIWYSWLKSKRINS